VTKRRPIIAANWKMHKTHLEAIRDVQKLSYLLDRADADRVEVVICPAFTALRAVQTLIDSDRLPYGLGAQNVHDEEKGAFTGEVSPPMLQALKCGYVIVGHSERRQHFGELDAAVGLKARAALRAGLQAIVCVGETDKERDANETFGRVTAQLEGALAPIAAGEAEKIVVAYEPVWAIGTGRTATPAQAQEVHAFIRKKLAERWSPEVAGKIRIQYGGSVKPENAAELLSQPDIDGALVGGASLKAESFVAIARAARMG
jgi:triosephosphate isomerase